MRMPALLNPIEPPVTQPPWRRTILVAIAGLLISAALLSLQFVRLGPDPTEPFFIGSTFELPAALEEQGLEDFAVDGNAGYDGQWFLGQGTDPFMTEGVIDSFDRPRYRAGRPLMGMVGAALTFGGLVPLPISMLSIGLLASALGAAATARMTVALGRSRWLGLGFLVPGVIAGITHVTAEPLALALAALGLTFFLDRRPVLAGLAFAGATLTKETYVVFAGAAALVVLAGWQRSWWSRLREAVILVVPGVALLGLWWVWILRAVAGNPSDTDVTGTFVPPLGGWIGYLPRLANSTWAPDTEIPWVLGAALSVGSLLVIVAGLFPWLRRADVFTWSAVLFGVYALALSPSLLGNFLSSMRALAPCVYIACLALVAVTAARPGTPVTSAQHDGSPEHDSNQDDGRTERDTAQGESPPERAGRPTDLADDPTATPATRQN